MSNNNAKRERKILTCIKIEEGGTVRINHGLKTATRYHITMAEGFKGQFWGLTPESLKNFPLNHPRWYEMEPLEALGLMTWKFYPVRTDALSTEEKQERMAYKVNQGSTARPTIHTSAMVQPPPQQPPPQTVVTASTVTPQAIADLQNSICSSAALMGAAFLVGTGVDKFAEIVPLAVQLKKHLKTVLEQ